VAAIRSPITGVCKTPVIRRPLAAAGIDKNLAAFLDFANTRR